MHRTIGILGGVALAALLGACSSNDGATPSGAPTTTAGPTTTSPGAGGALASGGGGGALASGGAGGAGGGGGGAGGGAFTPAAHGDPPLGATSGGRVLAKPKVRAISYASDPRAPEVDAFLAELASTPYWAAVTSEYGVGPLEVGPPIVRAEASPASLKDQDVLDALAKNLGGAAPAWGAADPSTMYLFLVPDGTSLADFGACCVDFDGYHQEAEVGPVSVPYAVVCACPGFDGPGFDATQQVTTAVSHELVEAATDPFPWSDPAWAQSDDDHAAWTLATGGELADLCEDDDDAFVVPAGATFMVQRSWSNAAAKAGHEPCVPSEGPYFNAVPATPDAVTVEYDGPWATRGVKLAKGASRTIDVTLFSDAPTDAFDVEAFDYSSDFMGGPKLLALSLDRATGANGDVLHLTIQALGVDAQTKAAAFALRSSLGNHASLWFGVVTN